MRLIRWFVVVPVLALAFVVMGASASQERSVPVREVAVAKVEVSAAQRTQMKRLSRKVGTFRKATWDCQDTLGISRTRASVSVWALPMSVAYRGWVVERWQTRAGLCRELQQRREMEWNWRAFPSWIIDLARCESSINWYAEGSSSHGVFYSAFNISRSVYDRDAHHMGVRGWNEGPGIPSPWEQAMAVIGHMRLYGDGFTGRCHGMAKSTWN